MTLRFKTADGQNVTVFENGHVSQHRSVLPHLHNAISKIAAGTSEFIAEEIEFPYIVGFSECVPTTESDDVFFATRVGRQVPTRFVRNRQPIPTKIVTVVMKFVGPDWVLVTAYIGPRAPREVGDPTLVSDDEKAEAAEFWSRNALIYSYQDM